MRGSRNRIRTRISSRSPVVTHRKNPIFKGEQRLVSRGRRSCPLFHSFFCQLPRFSWLTLRQKIQNVLLKRNRSSLSVCRQAAKPAQARNSFRPERVLSPWPLQFFRPCLCGEGKHGSAHSRISWPERKIAPFRFAKGSFSFGVWRRQSAGLLVRRMSYAPAQPLVCQY